MLSSVNRSRQAGEALRIAELYKLVLATHVKSGFTESVTKLQSVGKGLHTGIGFEETK